MLFPHFLALTLCFDPSPFLSVRVNILMFVETSGPSFLRSWSLSTDYFHIGHQRAPDSAAYWYITDWPRGSYFSLRCQGLFLISRNNTWWVMHSKTCYNLDVAIDLNIQMLTFYKIWKNHDNSNVVMIHTLHDTLVAHRHIRWFSSMKNSTWYIWYGTHSFNDFNSGFVPQCVECFWLLNKCCCGFCNSPLNFPVP